MSASVQSLSRDSRLSRYALMCSIPSSSIRPTTQLPRHIGRFFQFENCFPSTTDKRQEFYAMAKLQADFILETHDFVRENLSSFTK